MSKILYFDSETTGIDPVKNDIIQLSGAVEIDGDVKEVFDIKMQPHSFENISNEALEVHGMTIEDIKKFQPAKEGYYKFISILQKYVSKFDRSDKFYPAGYNAGFDINFVAEKFKKCGDKYLGSWWNWNAIDPLPILRWMDMKGKISLVNYKLETVCKHFGIEIKAHDALSDIQATIKVIKAVEKLYLKA